MAAQLNPDRRFFHFRTAKGKWLSDEIASIEKLATDRLRDGVAYHSVQTGTLVLLKLALEKVTTEMTNESARIQACTPAAEPPRCVPPEG